MTTEHVTFRIAGAEHEVVSLEGDEGISRLFSFKLVCRAAAHSADPESLLAEAAQITLSDGYGAARTITGIVAEAEVSAFDDGAATLTVTVRPAEYRLSLGRDCRTYLDLD